MRGLLVFCIIILQFILVANGQKRKGIPPEKPVLIIGIVIEDMRYDYLYRYWSNFTDNGFKKLIDEGMLCRNACYNYMLTQTSPGMATIATGSEPYAHGIVADQWFQNLQGKPIGSVHDAATKPIGSAEMVHCCSPRNLLTTTFTDELKLFNNSNSKVIGVSLNPESAILPVGHAANYAFWFCDKTGNWVTSSYYADSLPTWVNNFNTKKFADIYIQREWLPDLSLTKYRAGSISGSNSNAGFSSDNKTLRKISSLLRKDNPYSNLFSSPFGINLVKDFAISAIIDEKLGADDITDYLSVCFSATANVGRFCGPNSIELEDLYIKLDKEIAHFIEFINDTFEKQNVLIYLTSDHGSPYHPDELKNMRIPSGQFNSDRAVMLLGTYLNAVYGKGKWVLGYHNKQIYLNRQLVDDSQLKLTDVQETVAKFMIQFSGVANAITANTLENTNFTQGVFGSMQNSFNQKRSGDVMINLEAGWVEESKYFAIANSANRYDTHVPLIWYGWKIKRGSTNHYINITDIAPTISNFLDVPFSSGCTGKIINDLY